MCGRITDITRSPFYYEVILKCIEAQEANKRLGHEQHDVIQFESLFLTE